MPNPTHSVLTEAIAPYLSVIYSEDAPTERLGVENSAVAMTVTRITESAVIYRVGQGQHRDDDNARGIAAQLIVDGRLPRRGGVVRLTAEEVAA